MKHESPLLTRDEAIAYLRLDQTGVKNPARSFDFYRQRGLIDAVRMGRCLMFHREDFDKFIDEQRERDRQRP
jgi:hypothetical protein